MADFKEIWEYQESLLSGISEVKKSNGKQSEPPIHYLLFCEHPHVFTLGKSGKQENLLASEKELEQDQASFYNINRGGDITYHGPGQLVAYPILDLDFFYHDIHRYLRDLPGGARRGGE